MQYTSSYTGHSPTWSLAICGPTGLGKLNGHERTEKAKSQGKADKPDGNDKGPAGGATDKGNGKGKNKSKGKGK